MVKWRFGHFLTDGGEYQPNLAIMENPTALKFSRPLRLFDSFPQNFSRKALSFNSFFGVAVQYHG